MNQERLLKIILGPHMSEKTARLADGGENNQITFKVARDATKPEIKQAVEMLFEVTVQTVNVAVVKGKRKRFGQIKGRRSDWKKAYVRLAPGDDIEFINAE